MKHAISIAYFQEATGLADTIVMDMLRRGALPCFVGDDGLLYVDTAKVNLDEAVTSALTVQRTLRKGAQSLLSQRIVQLIGKHFSSCTAEAVERMRQRSGTVGPAPKQTENE